MLVPSPPILSLDAVKVNKRRGIYTFCRKSRPVPVDAVRLVASCDEYNVLYIADRMIIYSYIQIFSSNLVCYENEAMFFYYVWYGMVILVIG